MIEQITAGDLLLSKLPSPLLLVLPLDGFALTLYIGPNSVDNSSSAGRFGSLGSLLDFIVDLALVDFSI